MIEKLEASFREKFNEEPVIVRSPGRVNIIGEHTDYNEGFVLPGAIDKAIFIAASKRNDNKISLYANGFEEAFESTISSIQPKKNHWSNYILGIVDQFIKNGFTISGFNMLVDGNVPIGAGLSSSAAVECAAAFALNTLFNLQLEKLQMVKMAQQAEHDYAGVKVGIMDMFASMFGKKDHVIKLDCRSLDYEYIPFNIQGYKIVLLNTNVKHTLASTEYNARREQCEQGVELVKAHHPEVKSLRDVTKQMLDESVLPKNKLVYSRCVFIVEEIQRLLEACDALKRNDLITLGKKMFETHEGLSKQYAVSCKELDFLVDAVKNNNAVIGARMMGGGFGGCTINIVEEYAIDGLVENIKPLYEKEMQLPLTAYVASIEDGTSLLK